MEKNVRVWILIFLVTISLISLSRFLFRKSWVEISFIEEDANCEDLTVGDRIKKIDKYEIKSLNDYENALLSIKKGETVMITTYKGIGKCVALNDSDIGIRVKENYEKILSYGIDIEGGVRVLLRIKGETSLQETQNVVKILTERLNTYGLSDVKVIPAAQDLIQIEAAGLSEDDIRNFLVRQGYFEGKIVDVIPISNNVGKIVFDGKSFEFSINETHIVINSTEYKKEDGFYLDDVKYEIVNFTSEYVTIAANVFTSKDIENIFTDVQRNYIVPYADGYRFVFTIQISSDSAEKFAKITKGQPIYYSGGQSYIRPKLVLYLDKKPITELNIVSSIAGEPIRNPSIEGFRKTFQEASLEKMRLQSILKSGSLPVELEIERIETITETEGKKLFNSIIYILIANLIAVLIVSTIRYKNLYVSFFVLLVSIFELVLVLGVASSQLVGAILILLSLATGIYYKDVKDIMAITTMFLCVLISGFVVLSKWTIDIPTIAGLVSLIGNSGELIVLTDQIFLEKRKRIEDSIKLGMKIVFNSSALLTFSMLPLAFLGLGTLKGFAITTTLGTLIDLFITRPVYMYLLQKKISYIKEETI